MELLLDEPQRIFADTAIRLCADRGGAKRLRALRQAGDEMDREAWRSAIAAGWLATLAERDGAAGAGAVGCGCIPFGCHVPPARSSRRRITNRALFHSTGTRLRLSDITSVAAIDR